MTATRMRTECSFGPPRSCVLTWMILTSTVALLRMTLSQDGAFCEVYRFLLLLIVGITPLRQHMVKRLSINAIEMVKPWEKAVPLSLIFNLIWSDAGAQRNPERFVVCHRRANSTSRSFFRLCG